MTLLLACLAMAAKDGLGVGLMQSESRVAFWFAGFFDAGSDWANWVVNAYTAVPLGVHGWTAHNVFVMTVVSVTSFGGTAFWTWFEDKHIPEHRRRPRHHRRKR